MKKVYILLLIVASILLTFFIFIPAFRGDLTIPQSINIGPLVIRLYGIILAASILVGYLVAYKNSWRFGIAKTEIDNLAFWLVVVGVISARIYYVIFEYSYYSINLDQIYKIWNGGLSIFGALIGGFIFLLYFARKKAYSIFQLLDLVALSLPLAQAIGRLGNFINQEAFGLPTNLPWAMYVQEALRPAVYLNQSFFHPAFLYEALGNLIIFFVLTRCLGKTKNGHIFLFYLIGYSILRFFVESIRVDSSWISGFRVDQVVALLVFLCSSFLLIRHSFKSKISIDIH